jgi:orotate phosphoribosyltransferase
VVAASLTGITYDFGPPGIMKACITSMENYAHCFPKGHGLTLGVESGTEPHANKVVVFEDFFTAGL